VEIPGNIGCMYLSELGWSSAGQLVFPGGWDVGGISEEVLSVCRVLEEKPPTRGSDTTTLTPISRHTTWRWNLG
jgi:hypothetical protein